MSVVVLVGNPRPLSRTRAAAQLVSGTIVVPLLLGGHWQRSLPAQTAEARA